MQSEKIIVEKSTKRNFISIKFHMLELILSFSFHSLHLTEVYYIFRWVIKDNCNRRNEKKIIRKVQPVVRRDAMRYERREFERWNNHEIMQICNQRKLSHCISPSSLNNSKRFYHFHLIVISHFLNLVVLEKFPEEKDLWRLLFIPLYPF
jgi:hypothetical protein